MVLNFTLKNPDSSMQNKLYIIICKVASATLNKLYTVYIKTQNPVLCRQKSLFSHLDSSSKQWRIGPNWPFDHYLTSVVRKKAFKDCQKNVAAVRAVVKLYIILSKVAYTTFYNTMNAFLN